MKKMTLGLAAFSLLLFIGGSAVFAEDSVNIAVSCTVPAIPGVNAPLLEAQSVAAKPAATVSENQRIALKTRPEQPLVTIQEESEKENQSSESEKEIVLVKTFYVR